MGNIRIGQKSGAWFETVQLAVVDDSKSGTVFHFKEDVLGGKPFPPGSIRRERHFLH